MTVMMLANISLSLLAGNDKAEKENLFAVFYYINHKQ